MVVFRASRSGLRKIFRLRDGDGIILNGATNAEKETVHVIRVKQPGVLRREMKRRRTPLKLGRPIIGKLVLRRWPVAELITAIALSRRRTMQIIRENSDALVQLVVEMAELPAALQLIRRAAKARQHDDENQAIPKLQPPLDGFEKFHSMQ